MESDAVHVIDRAVPPDILKAVTDRCDDISYKFGWKSNRKTDPHGHWNYNILKSPKRSTKNHVENLGRRADFEPFRIYWAWLQSCVIGPSALLRCYVNAHTYGVDGYPHTDTSRQRGERTLVLYLNRNWEFDYAGETIVYNADYTDIELAVAPRFGRVLAFPSHRYHCARSPSRKCNEARRTLIVKAGPLAPERTPANDGSGADAT